MCESSDTSMLKHDDIVEWDNQPEDKLKRVKHRLIAKLWSPKPVNAKAAIKTMCRLWSTKHNNVTGRVLNVRSKMFVFRFEDKCERTRVLEGQPWHFDKFIWLLNEASYNGGLMKPTLFDVPLWVRVYDLPVQGRSNYVNATRIGNALGEIEDFDSDALGMRIRVWHDVHTPLKRHVAVRVEDGRVVEFPVKYERLCLFCYGCGVLGHGVNKCENGPYEEGTLKYGPWNTVS